jgi:preprotein translocase subunit SecF
VIGTWSSIFVAAPLLMFFGLKRDAIAGADARAINAAGKKA